MVQGHLEKLASNAKSIHHVLEALCGGLDRLEKKMDTNSSQVPVIMLMLDSIGLDSVVLFFLPE